MRVVAFCGILLVVVGAVARAEPLVVGFDRFHASAPNAVGGRLLYNELGCANCHGGDTGLPARRGPVLATATSRLRPDWIQAFLADPARGRAGTAMPHLLTGRDPADLDAVVHYLGTLAPKSATKPKLIRHIDSERGQSLFHRQGCVACHAPQPDFTPAEGRPAAADFTHAAVAFPSLEKKYVLASLAEFVGDPLSTRPDGRMPKTPLEDQDAQDIASYLLGIPGSDGEAAPKLEPYAPDPTRAERGRRVVAELRCAACHELPANVAVTTVPLRQGAGGCLTEQPAPGVPRYGLNPAQRQALQAYLANRDEPIAAAPRANLALEALNCVACHERDGQGGPDAARRAYFVGDHNLGDTGRYPPPLTGIGRKLQPDWLAQTLQGAAQVRPYLQTRMPIYGTAVSPLPAWLAAADARPETALPRGNRDAGRKLLGTEGGVSCITCHRWADRPALGIQALDISNLATRLQPGWLRDYLIDPAAYRPGTLMPSFWPHGKAANTAILGGDTDRQIASIVAFARDPRGVPEGFPSTTSREFELTPGQRPIVMRTFLQDVGTHAILVGFPAGVHLAYDGAEGRPALAWKGRFIDAYGTWFVRFAPFEKPLGEALVQWPRPEGPPGQPRFDGYRLDAGGVPTFLLSIGGIPVEDRFEATEHGLRRSLHWNPEALPSFTVSHPTGVTVTEIPDSGPGHRAFLYTW